MAFPCDRNGNFLSFKRLYHYYRTLAPELPNNFRDMEPLFSAVICGCNAGLFREALHEVYIPRIQRGNGSFAANVLGARGTLLSALACFFEHGRWGSLVEAGAEGQMLDAEEEAGHLITAIKGMGAPEAGLCYERAESLARSLKRFPSFYLALVGQWRHSLNTDKLSATLQIAKRLYALAQEKNDSSLLIGACASLAPTLHYLGDFEASGQWAIRGVQLWRSLGARSSLVGVDNAAVGILCHKALFDAHIGDITSSRATMAEAISLAQELKDMYSLAMTLGVAARLEIGERNLAEVERYSSDVIELSTRHHFGYWLAVGSIFRGWARSVSGDTAEGNLWVEQGIKDFRATGTVLGLPIYLSLQAQALHLARPRLRPARSGDSVGLVRGGVGLGEVASLLRDRNLLRVRQSPRGAYRVGFRFVRTCTTDAGIQSL